MDPKKKGAGEFNCQIAPEQKLEKSFPLFYILFPPAPVQMLIIRCKVSDASQPPILAAILSIN